MAVTGVARRLPLLPPYLAHGLLSPLRPLPTPPPPPVQVAIVRQLESELHIDGQHTTVDDLRRFVPTLWHVKVNSTHK